MIEMADKDGDGEVNAEEFMKVRTYSFSIWILPIRQIGLVAKFKLIVIDEFVHWCLV
jgi:hypothetical protein